MNALLEYFSLRDKKVSKQRLKDIRNRLVNDPAMMTTKTAQKVAKHIDTLLNHKGKLNKLFIPAHIKLSSDGLMAVAPLGKRETNCNSELVRLQNLIIFYEAERTKANNAIKLLKDAQQGVFVSLGVKF